MCKDCTSRALGFTLDTRTSVCQHRIMRNVFFLACLWLAACGPSSFTRDAGAPVSDAQDSGAAEIDAAVPGTVDAHADAAPGAVDAAVLPDAAETSPPDASPPPPDAAPAFTPWGDWTGSYTIAASLLPSSTCTEPASIPQNRLDINLPPWAVTLTEWSIDGNMATAFYTGYTTHFDGSFTFTGLPGGTYRVINDGTATAHQINATQFHVDAWVDHDTSPGNPDSPCHWDWNITGTRI